MKEKPLALDNFCLDFGIDFLSIGIKIIFDSNYGTAMTRPFLCIVSISSQRKLISNLNIHSVFWGKYNHKVQLWSVFSKENNILKSYSWNEKGESNEDIRICSSPLCTSCLMSRVASCRFPWSNCLTIYAALNLLWYIQGLLNCTMKENGIYPQYLREEY